MTFIHTVESGDQHALGSLVLRKDDVTAEVDVVSEDEVRPFCDVFDVRNDDFANVVLSGDLLRRSGDSRSQK